MLKDMPCHAWHCACTAISAGQIQWGDSGLIPHVRNSRILSNCVSACERQESQEPALRQVCLRPKPDPVLLPRPQPSAPGQSRCPQPAYTHMHLENQPKARGIMFCTVYHQNLLSKLKQASYLPTNKAC